MTRLLLLCLLLAACPKVAAPHLELGPESPVYTSAECQDLSAPGDASPEAAVLHYYASRIRGDSAWEEVLPPPDQRGERLQRKLEKVKTWRFESVQLLSLTPESEDRV